MASPLQITAAQLNRLIGTSTAPVIIDVRTEEDFDEDQRRCCSNTARLRGSGEVLEGGQYGWRDALMSMMNWSSLPPKTDQQQTVWVTRTRSKVDRIACPWLIKRFVDTNARFLYVTSSQVQGVAERFNCVPFDIDDVFWSHRDDDCTFDTMLKEFGLRSDALNQLANIIRAADTGHPDANPQAHGLLAASLGLSRMYSDDLAQLEAGLPLYDMFLRWCRDATNESHHSTLAANTQ